jgi:hypothetical protein
MDAAFPDIAPIHLAIICYEAVQLVLGYSTAGFGARRGDVGLGGDHGFVAQQFHQRVDADVGVPSKTCPRCGQCPADSFAGGLRR